ncbi:alpha/beta fold hydrolase [Methylobacterium pseudosasicola]|uniref:Pimeloyl-ACP methyl ester carboxylesterase n=1 Tax=Methylobacterium pseudosasicola TaxID=582667 RepID=A0A1I4QV17_9HYPH|nr:alpha/beta hydrolase [Methylobacterium pseudosasicola]SFM43553.1 Pimeloyl-ACP methyl ester carboxylesterase [Methylobacterium pseudosasicola]
MHHEHRIASGRASLAAFRTGQGQPVIFLHANVCDSRMWRDQMKATSTSAAAIAYDRRGFGRTSAESEDFSSVADLMAVIEAMTDGQAPILIGCSQGGKIALDFILQHASRVRGLILIAPSVGGAPEPVYSPNVKELMVRLKDAKDAGDLDEMNAVQARLWLDGPLGSEGRVQGQARQLFLDMNSIALRSPPIGSNLDTAPVFDHLNEVRSPTLVVWGNLDFPHIQDRCCKIVAKIPGALAYEIPGAAHVPSLEQPAVVTAAIVTFMQRLVSIRAASA